MKPSFDLTADARLVPWWLRWARAWNRFWFTPSDPTLLGAIRVCCGAITLYTMLAFSFSLQDFVGEYAWYDLHTKLNDSVRDKPTVVVPLSGRYAPSAGQPAEGFQAQYLEDYRKVWKEDPPPPYPITQDEAMKAHQFRLTNRFDFRTFGLRFPRNKKEQDYLEDYARKWGMPPPAYPATVEEERKLDDYMSRQRADPRRLYARGMPAWSLWFHVTDPTAMAWIHAGVCLVVFLFTIGFATRVTSALTWLMCLWYIHRMSPVGLFGADTMMVILLLYLMIGPSGAALSVDRLLTRWWSRSKLKVINRWRSWFGRPALTADQIVPAAAYHAAPTPSISANVAMRLLQVHVCIIYLIAGLAKLLGGAWWNGTAVWGTLANFEFAPMQFEAYNAVLRFLGQNQLVFDLFLTSAGLFTLAFEISYVFLVWRPNTRWWILSGAIILHGFIGIFMGLKTFSFMMLVMNMAFLTHREVVWMLSWFGYEPPAAAKGASASAAELTPKPLRPVFEPSLAGSTNVTAKK